jgi:phage-related protein
VRPACFLGDSLKCLRDFPRSIRHDAGYQLDKVPRDEQPDDFKPMPAVGRGVEEIRVSESSHSYRVVCLARRAEAVYILHALQKKTQATPKNDIQIARRRFRQLLGGKT